MNNIVYKNINYKTRDYECTNIVACEALGEEGPREGFAVCSASVLDGLQSLYIENNVRYYGFL